MNKMYQIRDYHPDHTRSVWVAKNPAGNVLASGVILELPWLDNAFQISCIPEGVYLVKRRWSKKFKWHYHIQDVTGRTFILQHAGNFTRQILGCQLPGDLITFLDADKIPDVANTRRTLDSLLKIMGDEYELHIGSFAPPKHPHTIDPHTNKPYTK
jgi:hypothetical protein